MATIKDKITDVKGIGPSTAAVLAEYGIKTVRDLASASVPSLIAIPGFNEFRAGQVKFNAQLLLKKVGSNAGAEKRLKPKAKAVSKQFDSPSPAIMEKQSEKTEKSKKDKKKSKKDDKEKTKSKKKAETKEKSKDKSRKKGKKKK
ncbi:MAG: helix-hairpin-helix domain-containing protein [Methylococcales bacterium]